MTQSHPSAYSFPTFDPETLKSTRIRSFCVSVFIALIPFLFNFSWIYLDIVKDQKLFLKSIIPDIAFASIGILIAASSNTVFSFTKLDGWKRCDNKTFIFLLVSAAASLISFTAYMRSIHATPDGVVELSNMLFISLCCTASVLLLCTIAQFTFVASEIKQSTTRLLEIPDNTYNKKEGF